MISPKACVYGNVEVHETSRIDDFCILTGNIKIGRYVHLGAFSFLSGGEGIEIADFCGFSPRTTMFTASDDYSGLSMSNPTVPDRFKPEIHRGPIRIGRHVLMGANCVILPGVEIEEGTSVGAFTLVNRSLDPWSMYAGIPARKLGPRKKDLLELEEQFKRTLQEAP
jgi:acetyltransferase-like isoleucine patch superfamily enzyme